jgi:hypothetical protein
MMARGHRLRIMRTTGSFTFQVALSDVMPAVSGSRFVQSRRFDFMIPGPGQAFGQTEAAALMPALVSRATTTNVVLAWIGMTVVFAGCDREWKTNCSSQVSNEGQAGVKPAKDPLSHD